MPSWSARLFLLCLLSSVALQPAATELGAVTGLISDIFNGVLGVVDSAIKEGLNLFHIGTPTPTTPAEEIAAA
ncbi:hypothetical protein V5799_027042 [Amblyomma americanum]|uniref:Secreted protein n=1 Tax=Amblyomma americanum TaxID=6943 RepID=A0AAQ4DGV1_AMBAM